MPENALAGTARPKLRIDVLGVPGVDRNIQLNAYLEGHSCTDGMMFKEGSCGYMILGTSRDAPYLFVIGVRVAADARRQLIGTRLYEKAAEIAAQYGLPLASDTSRTPSAEGFWKKQQSKGRARVKRPFGRKIYVLNHPPPTSLAGYIDDYPIDPESTKIWLSPEGEDIHVQDHEAFARKHGVGGEFPNQAFERLGWIRISIYASAISIEMETQPTAGQLRTLDAYLRTPGLVLRAVSFKNRYLQAEGFQRMTAGRIAAWVAQQASGGLGGTRAPKASHVGGCFDWVAYAARPFEFVFRLSDGNCGPEHRGVFADYMDTFEAHFEGYDDFKPAYTAVYAEAQRRFGTAKNAAFYRWPELLPPVTVRPFSTSPLAVVARSWGFDDRGPEHVDALVTAMKRRSLLPPVITFGASMEDGRHRVLAAAKLGLSVVPGWDINVLAQRVLQMYGPR